jgi:hypothetical protein
MISSDLARRQAYVARGGSGALFRNSNRPVLLPLRERQRRSYDMQYQFREPSSSPACASRGSHLKGGPPGHR